MDSADIEAFGRDGFLPPMRLYTPQECADLLRLVTSAGKRPARRWSKGQAASDPDLHRAALDPRLVGIATALLGPDVILWGVEAIQRDPGQVHHFHTDIESSASDGRFVSIWIGLNNTGPKSGLKFVSGSHRFGKPIQQVEGERGSADVDDETILAWAGEFAGDAVIAQPEAGDGVALVFDGRTWHGSHNTSGAGRRTALLLQYAAADQPVFMPRSYDAWPPDLETGWRPPVVAVAGRARADLNRVVAAPSEQRRERLGNSAHALETLAADPAKPFASQHHLDGSTPFLDSITGHTSILQPGQSPHPLHWHLEEELLVVISGEAGLQIADDAEGLNRRTEIVKAGDFAYYPAFLPHTLSNVGDTPLRYTMLKWQRNLPKHGFDLAPQPLICRIGAELASVVTGERFFRLLFETPTHWLLKLHAHLTVMPPGVGYDSHADPYDVAILLLSGSAKTLGKTVNAPALLFHPAGAKHGLTTAGDQPCRYIVFELHGDPKSIRPVRTSRRPVKEFLRRLRRKLRRLIGRA